MSLFSSLASRVERLRVSRPLEGELHRKTRKATASRRPIVLIEICKQSQCKQYKLHIIMSMKYICLNTHCIYLRVKW